MNVPWVGPTEPLSQANVILFDLDGTLVDTLPDLVHALRQTLVGLGLSAVSDDLVRQSLHGGLEATARAAARVLSLDESLALTLAERYAECYRDINGSYARLYQGVDRLLSDLQLDAGVRLGVCTNKSAAEAQRLLRALGIDHFMQQVVGADTCEARKPSPIPLQYAMSCLEGRPETTLMIGDSHVDAGAARAAHVGFVHFRSGYGQVDPQEFPVLGAFDHYDDLNREFGQSRSASGPARLFVPKDR
jgi:2-phosphoglycolate phosphatase